LNKCFFISFSFRRTRKQTYTHPHTHTHTSTHNHTHFLSQKTLTLTHLQAIPESFRQIDHLRCLCCGVPHIVHPFLHLHLQFESFFIFLFTFLCFTFFRMKSLLFIKLQESFYFSLNKLSNSNINKAEIWSEIQT
jgi:hypothetical protein